MNENRDLVSFPFQPHLAKFLFYTIKKEPIETEEARYKHLDIDLKSPDGRFIRILLEKADFPNIKSKEKGFRFTVSIPKKTNSYHPYIEDGRYGSLQISEECALLINDHFESRFREHFVSYVAGFIQGSNCTKGAQHRAIENFLNEYDLNDPEGYNHEKLRKYYQRSFSPFKKNIYDVKNRSNSVVES